MTVALWIVTTLLAVAFVASGTMKLTQPKPALVNAGQGWAEDVPDNGIKAIGTLEGSPLSGLEGSGGCQLCVAYAATPVSMSTQGSSPTVHAS